MPPMNRRDALKTTAVSLGGLLAATSVVLAACDRAPKRVVSGVLDADLQDLAEAMADTLLPTTPASPGAKAAGVGPAMNLLLTDCYAPAAQRLLVDGLKAHADKPYASLPRAERERILRTFDAESRGLKPDKHWFPLFRELALQSYFSSEIGLTKALRYTLVPGRWQGCVPLQPGQPAWG
jgi:glucoside 3-dehydrogenase (cytochrome c) hitch-hiker subunit